jgi:hypothetical protein
MNFWLGVTSQLLPETSGNASGYKPVDMESPRADKPLIGGSLCQRGLGLPSTSRNSRLAVSSDPNSPSGERTGTPLCHSKRVYDDFSRAVRGMARFNVYLRLQLAAKVLGRAIGGYREKHQRPVLSRASELFT